MVTSAKWNALTQADSRDQSSEAAGWSYAPPTGGIVSSAADVAVKTAAGVTLRNYISSMQLTADVLSAANELVIKDGSTVLHRTRIQTSGLPNGLQINFSPPLRGSLNTAVNIALTGSTTGGVVASLQGFVGNE
jgi:hypothetical protein